MVTDLRTGKEKTCDGNAQLGVEYLDSRETARKAGIVLAGRVPTDDELAKAAADGGLEALVNALTHEELFYDRLREIWNDALLTERGLDAGVGATFDNAPQLYDDRWPRLLDGESPVDVGLGHRGADAVHRVRRS